MSSFSYNTIYFLVSERDSSRHKDLYLTVSHRCVLKNIGIEYIEAKTVSKFKEALKRIETESRESGVLPYLHIEAHGNDKGIRLESGGRIKWDVLSKYFTDINIACKNNLFISFATCDGAHIMFSLFKAISSSRVKRTPFFGFVGPSGQVSYGELETGYELYFEKLIENQSQSNAIAELLKSSAKSDSFISYSCEQFFGDLVQSFITIDVERKFSSKIRFNSHVMELLMQRLRLTGKMPTIEDFDQLKRLLADEKRYVNYFNDLRRTFFMLDLYPENENRFRSVRRINNWNELLRNIR